MDEVRYSIAEQKLVDDYKKQADKKSSDWSLDQYVALRKTIKDHYLKKQNYTCCFCRQRIIVTSNRAWDVEHIICKKDFPEFMFEPMNLCVSCADCNREKGDLLVLDKPSRKRFPKKSYAYKTVHPMLDNYYDHIEVLAPGLLYRQLDRRKGKETYRTYGLDRFMYLTNREKSLEPNSGVKKLMTVALIAGGSEYDEAERELFKKMTMIMKKKEVIGANQAIDMLDSLT